MANNDYGLKLAGLYSLIDTQKINLLVTNFPKDAENLYNHAKALNQMFYNQSVTGKIDIKSMVHLSKNYFNIKLTQSLNTNLNPEESNLLTTFSKNQAIEEEKLKTEFYNTILKTSVRGETLESKLDEMEKLVTFLNIETILHHVLEPMKYVKCGKYFESGSIKDVLKDFNLIIDNHSSLMNVVEQSSCQRLTLKDQACGSECNCDNINIDGIFDSNNQVVSFNHLMQFLMSIEHCNPKNFTKYTNTLNTLILEGNVKYLEGISIFKDSSLVNLIKHPQAIDLISQSLDNVFSSSSLEERSVFAAVIYFLMIFLKHIYTPTSVESVSRIISKNLDQKIINGIVSELLMIGMDPRLINYVNIGPSDILGTNFFSICKKVLNSVMTPDVNFMGGIIKKNIDALSTSKELKSNFYMKSLALSHICSEKEVLKYLSHFVGKVVETEGEIIMKMYYSYGESYPLGRCTYIPEKNSVTHYDNSNLYQNKKKSSSSSSTTVGGVKPNSAPYLRDIKKIITGNPNYDSFSDISDDNSNRNNMSAYVSQHLKQIFLEAMASNENLVEMISNIMKSFQKRFFDRYVSQEILSWDYLNSSNRKLVKNSSNSNVKMSRNIRDQNRMVVMDDSSNEIQAINSIMYTILFCSDKLPTSFMLNSKLSLEAIMSELLMFSIDHIIQNFQTYEPSQIGGNFSMILDKLTLVYVTIVKFMILLTSKLFSQIFTNETILAEFFKLKTTGESQPEKFEDFVRTLTPLIIKISEEVSEKDYTTEVLELRRFFLNRVSSVFEDNVHIGGLCNVNFGEFDISPITKMM